MSFDTTMCFVVTCDTCNTVPSVDGHPCHWTTVTAAREVHTSQGWLFDGTRAECPACQLRRACSDHGHQWSAWQALSAIVEEGAGLLIRVCARCGRDEVVDDPFAPSPVTEEDLDERRRAHAVMAGEDPTDPQAGHCW